jgi:hypothetical protein
MKEKLLTNKTLCLTYDEERLRKIYEVCNRLFKDKEECFYTKEEVEKLKKNKKNIFL